jgi:hypothetical protein
MGKRQMEFGCGLSLKKQAGTGDGGRGSPYRLGKLGARATLAGMKRFQPDWVGGTRSERRREWGCAGWGKP